MKFLSIVITLLAISAKAEFKVPEMSPPGAKKAQKSQLARMTDIRNYKFAGYIGEADNGTLMIRDLKGASKEEQAKIKKAVEGENADRKVIFAEVSKHNKFKQREKDLLIKNTYEVNRNTDAKSTYHFENKKWIKK